MKRKWPLILAKIQVIELKHESVKNATQAELDDLHRLIGVYSTGPMYELTVYEIYIFERVLRGQISRCEASRVIGKSVRWMNPRIQAFIDDNYQLVTGKLISA